MLQLSSVGTVASGSVQVWSCRALPHMPHQHCSLSLGFKTDQMKLEDTHVLDKNEF